MAVKIPIVTVFDSKGIKQAQYQLRKVEGNINNLKRNFAIAGAAIAGVVVALGKTVTAASNLEAEFEGVNQVFGSAAKSVQDFAEKAGDSAGLTETAALRASKVFGLFAKGAGQSETEAAKFATTMVQLAGDLGSFNDVPTEEALAAIQSGLQGQAEPLRKFGVFLDDATLRQEALNMKIYDGKGPLTQQQKMMAAYSSILKQTTIQQGDFVKYADTYGNQLKSLEADFAKLSTEIGQVLLPIMAELIPVIRDVVAEIGPKLKAAMESVDWRGLIKTLGDLIIFFAQNADTILKVIAAMWTLNTAYNAGRVAIGLFNAAAVLFNGTLGATTTATGVATGAIGTFRTALAGMIPGATIIALVGLIGYIVDYTNKTREANRANGYAEKGFEIAGEKAKFAGGKFGYAVTALKKYKDEAKNPPSSNYKSHIDQILSIQNAWTNAWNARAKYETAGQFNAGFTMTTPIVDTTSDGGGSISTKTESFVGGLKKQAKLAKKEAKLIAKGLSEGLAEAIVSSDKPLKNANKVLKKIEKTGGKYAKKLQKVFNQTKAGQSEIAQQAEEQQRIVDEANAAAEAAAEEYQRRVSEQNEEARRAAEEAAAEAARQAEEQARELERLREEQARAEAEALAEQERIYQSFLDSVKNTFSQIKDSIMNAFDLTQLGGSTDSIIRNMRKLLATTKTFASNINRLSSMGLDPALLQQVIQSGPVAGSKLAAALVSGGAQALAEINAGYAQYGGIAGDIAATGVNSMYGTPQQQNVYNINVNGGVGSGASIGKAIVEAIKAYERTSGAVWVGA